MKQHAWKKKALAAVASAALLTLPVLAQEPQTPAPWGMEHMADSYAMGLVDDNYGNYILSPVTEAQLKSMTDVVADKLAVLELEQRTADGVGLVVDTTRGGVMNALYQEAAAYVLPGVEEGPEAFLTGLGVVQGNGAGDLFEDRTCTYQEAMVMANRLILAVYDGQDAGSKGLLWKATNGDNTLYLLGTIHADRDNAYPFHKSVRDAIAASEKIILELDPNDQEGMAYLQSIQTYSDGTTLADHIDPALYQRVQEATAALKLEENALDVYKPWALAAVFSNLTMADESTSVNAMDIDDYVYAAAANGGKTIGAVETYALQGNIFEGLSQEYQVKMLTDSLSMLEALMSGQASSEEGQEALEQQDESMTEMFAAWKARDPEAFLETYDKQAIVNSDDELNAKLFTQRDPNMIQAAATYLEAEGSHTYFMAVGAGHMVDPGGIVSGLQELGYTVELVP